MDSDTTMQRDITARFDGLVRKVLSVSHEEILRREAEYQKTRPGLNGKKRGRKPRLKPTV